MLDIDRLDQLRRKALSAPIVLTSIGPIDASANDLALDFPQSDWDLLMAARDAHASDIESYQASLLGHASSFIDELRASRRLLTYAACPQCGGKIEPLQVLKQGVRPGGRTIITERDYELCSQPFHSALSALSSLQSPGPCPEFEIHPEHCEVIRRCRLLSGHTGKCSYSDWV